MKHSLFDFACASKLNKKKNPLIQSHHLTWEWNKKHSLFLLVLNAAVPTLASTSRMLAVCLCLLFLLFPHLSFSSRVFIFFFSLFKTDFSSTFFLCTHFSNNIFSYSFHLLTRVPVSYRKIFIVHFIMLSLCITIRGDVEVIGNPSKIIFETNLKCGLIILVFLEF